jgi:hypothetical protein
MNWAWPSSITSIRREQFASWSACLASQIASCGGHDGCYNFLYILKAGPAGGLRPPSGPAAPQ